MYILKEQLINIKVIDGTIGAPNTGIFDLPGGSWLAIVIAGIILSALIFWLLRNRNSSRLPRLFLGLVILMLAFLPMATTVNALAPTNDDFSVVLKYGEGLETAKANTKVTLEYDNPEYAVIYAQLSSDINGKVGSDISISASTEASGDFSALKTTNQSIGQIANVTAPKEVPIYVKVGVSKKLPVGEYTTKITYRSIHQPRQISITFACGVGEYFNDPESEVWHHVTFDQPTNTYEIPVVADIIEQAGGWECYNAESSFWVAFIDTGWDTESEYDRFIEYETYMPESTASLEYYPPFMPIPNAYSEPWLDALSDYQQSFWINSQKLPIVDGLILVVGNYL